LKKLSAKQPVQNLKIEIDVHPTCLTIVLSNGKFLDPNPDHCFFIDGFELIYSRACKEKIKTIHPFFTSSLIFSQHIDLRKL
jgi:hypothetical protein